MGQHRRDQGTGDLAEIQGGSKQHLYGKALKERTFKLPAGIGSRNIQFGETHIYSGNRHGFQFDLWQWAALKRPTGSTLARKPTDLLKEVPSRCSEHSRN